MTKRPRPPAATNSTPPARKRTRSARTTHRVPLVSHDYRADPDPYPALKTEQGVFTTPPYSGEIKGLWRFKDEASARQSSEEILRMFVDYRERGDFIGMDTARKFIQMGRTRSLRYALRKGGQKYAKTPDGERGKEMKRTGEVYDEEKLKGANVFEGVLDRCWADEVYERDFGRWKAGERWAAETEGRHDGQGVKEGERKGGVSERESRSLREAAGRDEISADADEASLASSESVSDSEANAGKGSSTKRNKAKNALRPKSTRSRKA